MAHNLITSKSREENFMTVIDYSKRTIGFPNKVSRLSLQFGSAKHATRPEIIGLSQVRSLAFIGLKSCYYSSILEFKFLRVLILHIWVDIPSTGVDLKHSSELVLLRSLQVTCNDTVHLLDLTRGPKHLETLEINARVEAIPSNIVHLRLGVGTEVPDLTGTLKIVTTLNPPVSLDASIYSPDLVKSMKTMELLSPICGIPKWIGQLTNLCILKLVVRELLSIDICKLQELSFLTVLTLQVQRPATGLLAFAPGGFVALEYFEFRCGVLRLRFLKGTMPNLHRLKLGFNAHRGEVYGDSFVGIQDLSSVQEISGMIGRAAGAVECDLEAAE
ncbi:Disease resistance RPP13-like protein 4 [Hordeum vulgare]|nr:Disease resistance RPP13-like protein 4 [Hordeum vulgare]